MGKKAVLVGEKELLKGIQDKIKGKREVKKPEGSQLQSYKRASGQARSGEIRLGKIDR